MAASSTTNATGSSPSFTMNNNRQIPAIGLGTWQSREEDVYNAVTTALKVGYRHIDTAMMYGNEAVVGRAIRDLKVPRSELFVTTKLASVDHTQVAQALDASLERLGLEYVDLYLMHWPVALNPENKSHPMLPTLPNGKRDILLDRDIVDTYKDMQALVESGKAKAIGVSNFSIRNLKKLLAADGVTIPPAANQVELHPYLPQPELVKFCKEKNIVLEAYSPLGSTDSPLMSDKSLQEIANHYNASIANVLISWAVWRGTVVLPKSVTPSRIESNFVLLDLSDEHGQAINRLSEGNEKRLINPDWSPLDVFGED